MNPIDLLSIAVILNSLSIICINGIIGLYLGYRIAKSYLEERRK